MNLDYSPALAPQLLSDVARLTAPHLALRLAREFGGRSIYFPRKISAAHPLSRCVGFTAAQRLCREWGGEDHVVPAATRYLRWLDARALRLLGLGTADIARRLVISERQARHLLRGFDPAQYDIDDMVRAIGRLYGVRKARGQPPAAADTNQGDFGWPADAGGLRYKFV